MADREHFRLYVKLVMMVLLLATLLYSVIAVKQSPVSSNRLHQRQLDLSAEQGGFAHTFFDHNTSYSQHLQSRGDHDGGKALPIASDDEYDAARMRGEQFLCWLENPDEVPSDKATSQWNDYDQLKEWGWEDKSQHRNGGERDPGLKQIFDEADLDLWTNGDTKVVMEHTGEHPADHGISYPPTGAKYENYIYPRHGLFVAEYNYGPDTMIASKIRQHQWDPLTQSRPKLYQLSDIMWLSWAKYSTPENRSNLKIVAIHNIGNAPTVRVMAKIMQKTTSSPGSMGLGMAPEWPGVDFSPGTADFAALLGTQGVWALPYLLIQRGGPQFLGKRLSIEKITVFTAALSKWNSDPTFMIYLKDLE